MTNPVEWAEQEFGAQQVWQESQQVARDIAQELAVKDAFTAELRVTEFKLDEQKTAVAERASAAVAERMGSKLTQAAIDREVKSALASDDGCRAYRETIVNIRINMDAADSRVEALKVKGRMLTARMELVAQQLRFIASCKEAETVARNQLVGSPASRWPF